MRGEKMAGERRGKGAVITGASAGIGKALAEELAAGGTNLILTARRAERLTELAKALEEKFKIKTEVVTADLAAAGAAEKIFAFTREKNIFVELLVNNAGFGQYGELHEVETQRLLDMVRVNFDEAIFTGNGGAEAWRHFNSGVDGGVPGGAVYFHVCGDEGVRFAFCRRPG